MKIGGLILWAAIKIQDLELLIKNWHSIINIFLIEKAIKIITPRQQNASLWLFTGASEKYQHFLIMQFLVPLEQNITS